MRDAASANGWTGVAPAQRSGWKASARRAVVVSLALLAALYGWSRLQPHGAAWHGTPLQPVAAPAFAGFTSTQGSMFSWRQQRGRAVLVFFGYTHCPDVCPLTLAALARSLRRVGTLRQRVRVVFVTLDPQRDTLPVLRAYVDSFLPDAIGLRGTPAAVAAAARQWGVSWCRVDTRAAQYWIDHTAAVTLVGPDGRMLLRYGYAQLTNPDWLADDLRRILGS
jgi:protein SCO1/2